MNAQQLWQTQAADAPHISLAYVRDRTRRFDRRTQLRNGSEYVGGALAIGFYAWVAWKYLMGNPLMLAALGWFTVYGVAFAWYWNKLAKVEPMPADASVLGTLHHHRRQLERQRDVRRGNWRWWLPPMLPGEALVVASQVLEHDTVRWNVIGLLGAIMVVGTLLGIWHYERSADRLQTEIDLLDTMLVGAPAAK